MCVCVCVCVCVMGDSICSVGLEEEADGECSGAADEARGRSAKAVLIFRLLFRQL